MKVVLLEGNENPAPTVKQDAISKAIKEVPGPVWVVLALKFVLKWI